MIVPPSAMLGNPRFAAVVGNGTTRFVPDANGPLYAPKSAQRGRVARLDTDFVARAAEDDLCSACGRSFRDEAHVLTTLFEGDMEPPMHVACAAYALRACPHFRKRHFQVYVCARVEARADEHGASIAFHAPETKPEPSYALMDPQRFLEDNGELATASAHEAVLQAARSRRTLIPIGTTVICKPLTEES